MRKNVKALVEVKECESAVEAMPVEGRLLAHLALEVGSTEPLGKRDTLLCFAFCVLVS